MPSDYRYDPFSDTSTAVSITNELHVIPTASPFTIRLSEVPDKAAALTMKIRDVLSAAITTADATSITAANGAWFASGNVIMVDSEQMLVGSVVGDVLSVTRGYNSTVATTHTIGTAVFIENSMTKVSANPTSGQFWPDYSTGADNDENWNTGLIQFNAADAGKTVVVSYNGIGTLASVNAPLSLPAWAKYRGDGSDGDFIAAGGEILSGVKQYKSFAIGAGLTVNVGAEPLIILCQGAVLIDGTLNGASGLGGTGNQSANGGAGVGGGGNGGGSVNNGIEVKTGEKGTGGGAGGYGKDNQGAAVNTAGSYYLFDKLLCAQGETPSSIWQAFMLQNTLQKAGGGGAGGYNNGAGGGGGGTILLAGETVSNSGTLNVSGGAKSTSTGSNNNSSSGGGGGGASIVIIAKNIYVSGTISVKGGDAGLCKSTATSQNGGAGWYKIFTAG